MARAARWISSAILDTANAIACGVTVDALTLLRQDDAA